MDHPKPAADQRIRLPHLLICGRDLHQLIDLSIGLRGASQDATVAVTDDVAGRALSEASRGNCQVVACLDGRDAAIDLLSLKQFYPPILFLVSESALHQQLKRAGCLVLAAHEANHVIEATLAAYSDRPVRTGRE